MPKGVPNRRYTAEFKTKVIETIVALQTERKFFANKAQKLKA